MIMQNLRITKKTGKIFIFCGFTISLYQSKAVYLRYKYLKLIRRKRKLIFSLKLIFDVA